MINEDGDSVYLWGEERNFWLGKIALMERVFAGGHILEVEGLTRQY